MKNQITTEKILGYVLVAWIIISSGSQHFRIYNAVPTILFLFFLSILYGGVCRKMDKSVLWRVLSIGFILLLNIMVHEKEKIDYDAGRCCGGKCGNGTRKRAGRYHRSDTTRDRIF